MKISSALCCLSAIIHSEVREMKIEKEYGMWPSPIGAKLIAQGTKRFGTIEIDNQEIYWEEMRPLEGGRTVIVSEQGDCLPAGYSACSTVHEYGGKSFTVHKGVVYFVNDKDQRIYTCDKDVITPLTEQGARFADLLYTKQGLIGIREVHVSDPAKVDNALVLIDLDTGADRILASGQDFYSSPSLNPNGSKLCWLSWNLPNMPWDGTQLWVADFIDGKIVHPCLVAGGIAESIFQPQWGPGGFLYFISDRSGWWNLYRLHGQTAESLCPLNAEFGLPQWQFGMSTYGFLDAETILCTYFQNGISSLALLDVHSKKLSPLDLNGMHFAQVRCSKGMAAFFKGSSSAPTALIKWDAATQEETVLTSNKKPDLDDAYFSIAKPISYPSANGRTAFGFYYAPSNKEYCGSPSDLPPLIVKIHGGPTAHATGTFNLGIQFWTSRGFAVLDVNYGGSTGYGRAYRDLLKGNWGVVDVQDCEYGARYLIDKGYVDPQKIAITGGSAGGYTTLAALTFGSQFTVGASYYGVSDPVLLAKETHKFESKYLDQLIGPYPERSDLYEERSPLAQVSLLKRPVIFFQGLQDKVVPPDQAEVLYLALKDRDIDTKLVLYPEEKHGFKKAENIIDSLNQELAFYLHIFYP
jgi:dipeptidyl aminopeptidase/acylaminoacyl peptidase